MESAATNQHVSGSFAFTRLRREDLPLLTKWFDAPHVSPWFGRPQNAELDPLGEQRPVHRYVASFDGRPIGLMQLYDWSDFPENAAAVSARSGEVGIDYLIGEADMIGHGVGPEMVAAFLVPETLGRGDVTGVRVDVSESNERSWRCLEKVGFRRAQEGVLVPGQEGRHFVYVRESHDVGVELIRRARADDGPAIANVWLDARRAAAIPPAAHGEDEVRAWISGVLPARCEVWVATDRDEVVGMMALDGEWVEQLYVSPEHQRRGYGRRLLEQAMADRGRLTLWTFESNVEAQRFYEAHGFVRLGVASDDNEEHAPAIRYRWERSS